MQLEPMIKRNLSDEVRDKLLIYIHQMDMRHGTKLPAEAELAVQLGVSRITLRRALGDLEQSGLLLRIHGKGTFVNQEAAQIKLNLAQGRELREQIIKSGYTCRSELIRADHIIADQKLAQALQIESGSPIVEFEKVFYANNHPAIVCVDRFPEALLPRPLTKEEEAATIFNLLRKVCGKIIVRDKVEVSTMTREEMAAESRFSDNMNCGSLLVLHSVNYDQNNAPIIYDTEFYDTQYIRFHLIRPKELDDYYHRNDEFDED